jgi:hypothetical protein
MASILKSLDETQLRSLKFSEFTGREPFVLKSIDTKLESRVNLQQQVTKRAEDLVRITKLLASRPGLKFIANTSLLTLSENIKKSEKLDPRTIGRAALQTGKTVASTLATILAQTPVNGTGIRFSADELAGTTYLSRDRVKNSIDIKLKMGGSQTTQNSRGTAASVDFKNNVKVISSAEITEDPDTDIIPFKIQIITGALGSPNDYLLYFRAYLEDLSDNFRGEWNSNRYIGRGESFYNYNGFDRSLGFSFKIAATSRAELIPLYQKLNFLVGSTAPNYGGVGGDVTQTEVIGPYMRANFTRLTIGDYLSEVPGFFESIDVSWDKSYPWEIKRGRPTEQNENNIEQVEFVKILPHVLDVRASFRVIHDFSPSLGESFIGNFNINNPTVEQLKQP